MKKIKQKAINSGSYLEVKLGYKYKVGQRGRGRNFDSGVNRESLASRKPGDFIVQYCSNLFIFILLLFPITDSNTL